MQDLSNEAHPRTKKHTRRIVAIVVAVQVAIPLGMLAARWVNEGSQPVSEYPLSWQMYSAVDSGTYVGNDGVNDIPLNSDDLPPFVRYAGYGPTVPEMLCEANPQLISVAHVPAEDLLADQTDVYSCS